MKKTAYLFPGQGAQYVGMGKDIYERYPASKNIFEIAGDILKKDMKKLIFDSTEEELKITANTQPAMITVEIAFYEAVKSVYNKIPALTAGHSVGETAACYVCGLLSIQDTFRLIEKRAFLMQRESEKQKGKMYAIIGSDENTLNGICENIKKGVVVCANLNTNGQIVISGDEEGTSAFLSVLSEKGMGRAIELKVSGAWHSPLMSGAYEEYRELVHSLDFQNKNETVFIMNRSGKPESDIENIKDNISKQIISPVRWIDTMNVLKNEGTQLFIELGPGNVLTGLLKKYDAGLTAFNIQKMEDIEKMGELL